MKGLVLEFTSLGLSKAKFLKRAQISRKTLHRIDEGLDVHPYNLAKAQNALATIKAEFEVSQLHRANGHGR